MSDLQNLSVYVATREQIVELRKRSYTRWGKGYLTMEEYLALLDAWDGTESSTDGKLIIWVLAPRNDPETLDFLCGCQSYRRDGRYFDGELRSVACYNVGFVFTPEEKRQKGYAKHMLRLLHWVLADERFLKDFPEKWGAPPKRVPSAGRGYFSALYSVIGTEFYKSCGDTLSSSGWVAKDAWSTIWEVEGAAGHASRPTSDWRLLDDKEVADVWEQDVPLMERDLVELGRSLRKPVACFLPNQGTAAFQLDRVRFSPPYRPFLVESWGIVLTIDGLNYATWTVDVRPPATKSLLFTRLRAHSTAHFKDLMGAVLWFAKENCFTKVEAWNLPPSLVIAAQEVSGVTTARDTNFPSFKAYAEDDVEWVFNEK
ncbi:hypothetical protein HDZ31DRAFT_61839 [Schizophyllum fasciatum]